MISICILSCISLDRRPTIIFTNQGLLVFHGKLIIGNSSKYLTFEVWAENLAHAESFRIVEDISEIFVETETGHF